MKKILFILFTVQFVLAPHITKSYSVNSIEDSYEYSIVNQEKKTVKKDILGNTIIEDDNGNKITIKKPEGVGVYFDGDYVGIAPVSIRKTAGTHTITLYKAGYLIKSYTIQAEDNGKDDEYSYADLISVLD